MPKLNYPDPIPATDTHSGIGFDTIQGQLAIAALIDRSPSPLFHELQTTEHIAANQGQSRSIYTLQPHDITVAGRELKSAYQVYLEAPTELCAARRLLGSTIMFNRLKQNSAFLRTGFLGRQYLGYEDWLDHKRQQLLQQQIQILEQHPSPSQQQLKQLANYKLELLSRAIPGDHQLPAHIPDPRSRPNAGRPKKSTEHQDQLALQDHKQTSQELTELMETMGITL